MSKLTSLDDLSEELIDSICNHSTPLFNPSEMPCKQFEDSGYWTVVYRRLFSAHTRIPVPKELLSLRLVSKRLNRISTPYAWQRVDLQITKEASKVKGKRSRNSFEVLDFISSRDDISSYIKVLSLDVQDYLGNEEDYSPEVGKPIEKLLQSLNSLIAFNIASAPHLSPVAVKTLLSKPTLRLLHVSGGYSSENDDFNFEPNDIDLSHLRAYCTNRMHSGDHIMMAAPNLKHVVLHHHQDFFNYGGDDFILHDNIAGYPWLTTVEELEIADSSGNAMTDVAEAFKVANSGKAAPPLKELRLQAPWTESDSLQEEYSPGQITSYYASANLHILSMYEICALSSEDLSMIVKAFPNLVELGLVDYHVNTEGFSEFVEILGQLKSLQTLEWNVAKARKGASPEDAGLPELCAHLPSLQNVIITGQSIREELSNYFYTIERGEDGGYKAASVKVGKNLQTPITSWELTTTPYLL